MKGLRPFTPISPGEIVEEELQARGWSQRDLAAVLGRPVQVVNEIVAGKKAITPETALALSEALGTSADYWLGLESRYRLDLLQSKKNPMQESTVQRRAKLFSKVPVNELIKRGWIKADLKDLDRTEQAVCDFLKIRSLDDEPEAPFSARKTRRDEPHTPAQIAWACRVRNVAGSMVSPKYSKAGLATLIKELPWRSRSDRETLQLPAALAPIGVRLVIVEHLSGTRIDGGALWLGEVPVVALSLRYDRVDWFWFTIMHELAHILEREGSLDTQLVGNDAQGNVSEIEERADKRATDWLVPQDQLQGFADRVRPYFSRSAIQDFADRIKIHPGIVVGQLQKRGEIPYSHHRNLLTRVRHLFSETEPHGRS
jgi:HTH-type transcriptional regulator/antitoxin HigA